MADGTNRSTLSYLGLLSTGAIPPLIVLTRMDDPGVTPILISLMIGAVAMGIWAEISRRVEAASDD